MPVSFCKVRNVPTRYRCTAPLTVCTMSSNGRCSGGRLDPVRDGSARGSSGGRHLREVCRVRGDKEPASEPGQTDRLSQGELPNIVLFLSNLHWLQFCWRASQLILALPNLICEDWGSLPIGKQKTLYLKVGAISGFSGTHGSSQSALGSLRCANGPHDLAVG